MSRIPQRLEQAARRYRHDLHRRLSRGQVVRQHLPTRPEHGRHARIHVVGGRDTGLELEILGPDHVPAVNGGQALRRRGKLRAGLSWGRVCFAHHRREDRHCQVVGRRTGDRRRARKQGADHRPEIPAGRAVVEPQRFPHDPGIDRLTAKRPARCPLRSLRGAGLADDRADRGRRGGRRHRQGDVGIVDRVEKVGKRVAAPGCHREQVPALERLMTQGATNAATAHGDS